MKKISNSANNKMEYPVTKKVSNVKVDNTTGKIYANINGDLHELTSSNIMQFIPNPRQRQQIILKAKKIRDMNRQKAGYDVMNKPRGMVMNSKVQESVEFDDLDYMYIEYCL